MPAGVTHNLAQLNKTSHTAAKVERSSRQYICDKVADFTMYNRTSCITKENVQVGPAFLKSSRANPYTSFSP